MACFLLLRQICPEAALNVLVIDVGGSHVKLCATGQSQPRRFRSGKHLTPDLLVKQVQGETRGWKYDAIALGYPGDVAADGPARDPANVGRGWVGYEFDKAFGRPVRIVNDAVMQALGGYDGGRMLFVGLGTGLGSALVAERVAVPLELGCLPFNARETLAQRLGKDGLSRHGLETWRRGVTWAAQWLCRSFAVDYLVLGGGNAKNVHPLPPGTRRGGNEDAFTGGFRLWEERVEPHDGQPAPTWRIVR